MIRLERLDRRSVLVATVVTLIALPSLWLTNRDDPSTAPAVAVAGMDLPDVATSSAASEPSGHDALGDAGGAFLARSGTDRASSRTTDGATERRVVTIAVPRDRSDRTVTGRATYRSSTVTPGICSVDGAPFGAQVTVTNVDNGYSVTCTASAVVRSSTHDVLLRTEAFARIADLSAAPVPVLVSW